MKKIQQWAEKNYVYLVFFVSFLSVFGSLYFSEVAGLPPCYLCWYQRILIYPLLFLSAVSLVTKERLSKYYILAFTIPGMLLAGYHYLYQKFGLFKGFTACDPINPCDKIDFELLGFITIPLLSFLAFLFINTVILLTFKRVK